MPGPRRRHFPSPKAVLFGCHPLTASPGFTVPLRDPVTYGGHENVHLRRTFQAGKIKRMATARVSRFNGGKITQPFGAVGQKSLAIESYFALITVVFPRTRTAPGVHRALKGIRRTRVARVEFGRVRFQCSPWPARGAGPPQAAGRARG